MTLYESLAPVYDALFPTNPRTPAFLASLVASMTEGRPRVLDAGCATGDLVWALAGRLWKAVGVDSETAMIDAANKKTVVVGAADSGPSFFVGDILALEDRFGDATFELILCLGNTLPHLDGEAGAVSFLAQARAMLSPGGSLVLQTLNYALPGVGPGFAFPETAAGGAVMRRSYLAPPADRPGSLRFVVELSAGGLTNVGETLLRPLAPTRIQVLLKDAGFEAPRQYSDWEKHAFDEGRDLYCITVAAAPTP